MLRKRLKNAHAPLASMFFFQFWSDIKYKLLPLSKSSLSRVLGLFRSIVYLILKNVPFNYRLDP